jgi:mono/diheme cytochrome c family protein
MRFVKVLISAAFALSPLCMSTAGAADAQSGKLLYETHCGACHYEKLHERKSSRIDTLARLQAEVAKWAAQTNRRFTDAELGDIAEYLNQSHYRLVK